jgi:hypothetical protein
VSLLFWCDKNFFFNQKPLGNPLEPAMAEPTSVAVAM